MFTFIRFFFVLLITIVQSQNVSVQFSIFPVDTDIGSCTCDLTANKCDVSCCCDPDCSVADRNAFECNLRDNQYTNSTPIISTVQPTCFKNISIFQSNSPYIIQKMGELVCIDFQRYSGSEYYQQPNNQTLDPSIFVQAIDIKNSVLAPAGLPTNLSNYQVGTPILIYNTVQAAVSEYSLPVNLFNNQFCSGSQTITYMNDFTSTCSQVVNAITCNGTLNPLTYIDQICFIKSPSPSNSYANSAYICNTTGASTSFISNTCTGALQSLTITISYSNPTGIVTVSPIYSTTNASNSTPFEQTFTVRFVKSVPSSSATSNATRNPGYLQGANIIAGTSNGSMINIISSSQFALLQPSSTDFCNVNANRIPIVFGENVRSTCKFNVTSTSTCPNLYNLFIPINSMNLYVAAYSNPNSSNISDWLPVISCTSQIGSPNTRVCQNGIMINSTSNDMCYVRLDIQIAYTNIGSIFNPQPVLSAVIFYYQGIPTTALPTTLLVIESVTFQDISNAPVIVQGQIPAPNTRLPADFFYPFSTNQATKSMTFSAFSYFLISILFILM